MMKIQSQTKKAKSKGEKEMSEQKIKVSELSEQEQKDLIAEAYAVGLKGVFTTWNVETLKNKIAEAKGDNSNDEQKDSTDEQNTGENEQNVQNDEQNADNMNEGEQNDDLIPEGASEETKEFLNGETDNLPSEAEEIGENEAKVLEEKAAKKQSPKQEIKKGGICHICRSRVVNGVCTGCGFHK